MGANIDLIRQKSRQKPKGIKAPQGATNWNMLKGSLRNIFFPIFPEFFLAYEVYQAATERNEVQRKLFGSQTEREHDRKLREIGLRILGRLLLIALYVGASFLLTGGFSFIFDAMYITQGLIVFTAGSIAGGMLSRTLDLRKAILIGRGEKEGVVIPFLIGIISFSPVIASSVIVGFAISAPSSSLSASVVIFLSTQPYILPFIALAGMTFIMLLPFNTWYTYQYSKAFNESTKAPKEAKSVHPPIVLKKNNHPVLIFLKTYGTAFFSEAPKKKLGVDQKAERKDKPKPAAQEQNNSVEARAHHDKWQNHLSDFRDLDDLEPISHADSATASLEETESDQTPLESNQLRIREAYSEGYFESLDDGDSKLTSPASKAPKVLTPSNHEQLRQDSSQQLPNRSGEPMSETKLEEPRKEEGRRKGSNVKYDIWCETVLNNIDQRKNNEENDQKSNESQSYENIYTVFNDNSVVIEAHTTDKIKSVKGFALPKEKSTQSGLAQLRQENGDQLPKSEPGSLLSKQLQRGLFGVAASPLESGDNLPKSVSTTTSATQHTPVTNS
jgi:hypothetical protein